MISLTVVINTCEKDCRHAGHSGAFTKGGARSKCDHGNASGIERVSKKAFKKEYPMYASHTKKDSWKYHWIHRVFELNSIPPDWCPLKHGEKY